MLENGELKYYKNKAAADAGGAGLKGAVYVLASCTIELGEGAQARELAIIPLTPRGGPRELRLRAPSDDAQDAWFHALLRHRDVRSSQRGSTITGVNPLSSRGTMA